MISFGHVLGEGVCGSQDPRKSPVILATRYSCPHVVLPCSDGIGLLMPGHKGHCGFCHVLLHHLLKGKPSAVPEALIHLCKETHVGGPEPFHQELAPTRQPCEQATWESALTSPVKSLDDHSPGDISLQLYERLPARSTQPGWV